jgi:DnaJ-class molecular chaperone
VRYKVLTVKLPEDMYADLEAYALQEFPDDCRKCQGQGEIDGYVCQYCKGSCIKGNLSEASRYLLNFALGEGSSPEARAMAAAYADFRSKWVGVMTQMVHKLEGDFHQEMIMAMRNMALPRG